jgi:RimJ/RimL family protein N-acetyltransferase
LRYVLDGAGVGLRELYDSDHAAMCEIWGHPEVMRHTLTGPLDAGQVSELLAQAAADREARPRARYRFAVCDTSDDGRLLGTIALERDRLASAYASGAAFHPAAQGRGVGREVMRLLYRLAFAEFGARQVWMCTVPANAAAARMLLSTGARRVGQISEAYERDGRWRPLDVYAIRASDWHEQQPQQAAHASGVGLADAVATAP